MKRIFLTCLLAIALFSTIALANRPQYCDNNGCVLESVFEMLPEFPNNFYDIWNFVYYGKYNIPENFFNETPDENYYRQPEFYANDFKEQFLHYYTILKPNVSVPYNVAGSGPYPGDTGVLNMTQGDTTRVITYWHAGPGIVKYQGFKLMPVYPEHSKLRMADIVIDQDIRIAEQCFGIKITPENILIEPTYPVFFPNWTRKIEMDITVKDGCPSGKYMIQLIPGDLDSEVEQQWIRQYGLKLSSIVSGGQWQIYVEVVNPESEANQIIESVNEWKKNVLIATIVTVAVILTLIVTYYLKKKKR